MPWKRKLTRLEKKENIEGYFFISLWLVGLAIFTLGPIIFSLILSFFRWDLIQPAKFIGLRNWTKLFSDELFWQSTKVTFIYTFVCVPLHLVTGLAIALLLNQKIKAMSAYRTIYYMPAVVGGAATAILWILLLDPNYGVINYLLSLLKIEGPNWLGSEEWALPALIITSLWGVGGGMLIYLAGLQSIPTPLYEAAKIDGANMWQRFWRITLPMLSPIIFFNLVMGIINTFQIFGNAFIMTGGGPHYATHFFVLYLYSSAFKYLKMGYASALAWVLFFIIMALTLLVIKFSSLWVYYEGIRTKGR